MIFRKCDPLNCDCLSNVSARMDKFQRKRMLCWVSVGWVVPLGRLWGVFIPVSVHHFLYLVKDSSDSLSHLSHLLDCREYVAQDSRRFSLSFGTFWHQEMGVAVCSFELPPETATGPGLQRLNQAQTALVEMLLESAFAGPARLSLGYWNLLDTCTIQSFKFQWYSTASYTYCKTQLPLPMNLGTLRVNKSDGRQQVSLTQYWKCFQEAWRCMTRWL